jgi:hypothetical protein
VDVLTAGLTYAERGFYVFPVKTDNTPATRHGVYDATYDLATIERWYANSPGRGLALATGGPGRVFVADADRHDPAIDGVAGYHAMLPDLGEPWEVTPRRGEHHFFTWPAGRKLPDSGAGILGPGIDHRCTAGYVVVAPTITPRGAYVWRRDILAHPLPLAPDAIIDVLSRSRQSVRRGDGDGRNLPAITLAGAIARLNAAQPGTRNQTLNLTAYLLGRLVAAGTVKEDDARRQLTETALGIGLTPYEVEHTINSGLGDGMQASGALPASENLTTAAQCLSWGLGATWPGRCGLSDRRVYLAHTMTALACGCEVYGASVRRLAELANVGAIETARKSTTRLIEANLLDLVHLATRGAFTPNGYRLRTEWTITQATPGGSESLGNCLFYAHFVSQQGHDVFSRRGLGPVAGQVWDTLRAAGPLSAAQLAEKTGRGRRAVEIALRRMTPVIDAITGEFYPLLTKAGRLYAVREGVDLDAVAELLHVAGVVATRRARHEREREQHSQGWQEVRARQRAGTLPKPMPRTADEVQRTKGAHDRLDALRGVVEHGRPEG